jgi:ribosomal-protein-alanine N-acetyltransferase
VAELDKLCYANPLTLLELQTMLRRPHCTGAMVVVGDRLIGYNIFESHKDRYTILRFAVHPEFRRQAVGTRLFQYLAKQLSTRKSRIIVEVPETDLHSQLFFRALQFRAIHIERGGLGTEDVYIMQYRKTIALIVPQSAGELTPHQ